MNLVENPSNWTNSTDKDAIGTPGLKKGSAEEDRDYFTEKKRI